MSNPKTTTKANDAAAKNASENGNGKTAAATAKPKAKPKAKTVPISAPAPTLTPEQILQAQIDSIKRKGELIGHLNTFRATKASIAAYVAEQGTDFDPQMDHNRLKIVLQDDRGYSENPISISNNGLVRDFCDFLSARIDQKMIHIEQELLS